MEIKLSRLKKNLIELGKVGYEGDLSSGLPYGGQGITRPAFTPEYEEADELVEELMKEAGLEVYRDSVGNLFGRMEGNESQKSIIIGSHIDTVPCGGMLDGSLGVLSALESLQTLIENSYENKHTLEVGVFIGEEGREIGGTFGSRCFTGEIELEEKEVEFLEEVGISVEDVKEAKVDPEGIKNYLELHIEQGLVLETEEIPIGIVKGISGISRYKVVVEGEANHAGTTPMDLRDDALVKASEIVIRVNEIVKELGGSLVGTVGELEVEPGAVNVIPGRVEFLIELRDMDKERVEKAISLVQEEVEDLEISVEDLLYEGEVYLDGSVQTAVQEACENLDYDYKYMFSGAGHDANPISKIAPTGMIFVPSKDGVSHAPEEWTEWEDIEKGANVMLETIKILDNN